MENGDIFTDKFWKWFDENMSAEDRSEYMRMDLPLNSKKRIELKYWAKYPFGRIGEPPQRTLLVRDCLTMPERNF